MKAVSVGFVGAGFSANLHAEGLKRVFGVPAKPVAVVASSRSRAETFAARHDIPTVHATYADLLADPTVDVVCVCVPNTLHEQVIIAAAEAGKHIICEKPLTGAFGSSGLKGEARAKDERDIARAAVGRIREAVQRAGIQFMYAENWIYAPSVTKSKQLLRLAGGAIIDIRAEESHSGSHAVASRRRATAGGGALLVMGAHPVAAVLHMKAFESSFRSGPRTRVTSVTAETAQIYSSEAVARLQTKNWTVDDWEDVETWANLVMSFSDGTKAVVNASFAMLGGVRNVMEIFTTNAVYQNNMTPNTSLHVFTPDAQAFGQEYLHEKLESRTGWISASPDEDWVRGYPQEMQDFMEAVANGREPVSGLQLASDVVDVIYAAYLSAERGSRVALA